MHELSATHEKVPAANTSEHAALSSVPELGMAKKNEVQAAKPIEHAALVGVHITANEKYK